MKNKKAKIIVNKFGGGILVSDYLALMEGRLLEQLKKGQKPVVVVSALNGTTDKLLLFFLKLKKERGDSKETFLENKKTGTLINSFIKNLRKNHLDVAGKVKFSPKNIEDMTLDFDDVFREIKNDLLSVCNSKEIDVLQDKILSYGEKLGAIFFYHFLESREIKSKIFFAEDVAIETDNIVLDANINYEKSSKNIKKILKHKNVIPIINGFVGRNQKGNITTLGRGGTDTTACFVGAALKAEKIILWKDTDGVLSADPRLVPNGKTVSTLDYKEAVESGKIIHDKAIHFVKKAKVPLEVTSIINPQKHTTIEDSTSKTKGAKIIGFKKGLTLLVITDDKISEYGFLYNITKIFNDYGINMVLIRNTRDSLHIVVESNNKNLQKVLGELKNKKHVIKRSQVSMVTLIGELNWKMVNDFNEILLKTCSSSELGAFPYSDCVRLEAIIKGCETKEVVRALHKKFIK